MFIVYKYVLSNKPCLHAQLQKHKLLKSNLVIFPEVGHLNSFSAR